ncbi:MAG: L,D-transpeptidase family protein [Candidatus Binataceae bacterium]
MIARTARTAATAAAILAMIATVAFAHAPIPHSEASNSPSPTPAAAPSIASDSPTPAAVPSIAIDSGWAPAKDSPAYDPNAKVAASPAAEATAAATQDSRKLLLTAGQIEFERTRDASYLDPLSWNITAYKSRHELIVYYKGRLYRTYSAVFGRSMEAGTKLWEGDRRTPEGVYTIIGKHPSRRWKWFLGLNYPNEIDRQRYEALHSEDEIPVEDDGHEAGEGGHIGIHGTDLPVLNSGKINWTTGCISVENQDIEELSRILPVGTVIIIRP